MFLRFLVFHYFWVFVVFFEKVLVPLLVKTKKTVLWFHALKGKGSLYFGIRMVCLVSRRFSSERFLSTCLCGCPVLSEPRAKDKCLVYLSVGWCPGICFAKFRRKSAGGKVAYGFVCRGWTKKLSTKCSVLQKPKAWAPIPCLSFRRLVSWDFFREVSSEKCWGQSSTWICLQRGGRTGLLPDALPSRSRRPRTNSLFVSVSVCLWPCV